MKLSCSTNSPGAYADKRARRRARTKGARSSCFMAGSCPGRLAMAPASLVDMKAAVQAPVTGLITQVLLLAAFAGRTGWVVGVACGVVANAALGRGLSRYRIDRLG